MSRRPRFFVPDLTDGPAAIALSADEAHHWQHVLRGSVGDEVGLFDGRGGEWIGAVTESTKKRVLVSLHSRATAVLEPRVSVTVGAGLIKGSGGAMDDIVRDVTALGAAAIVPVTSAHVAAGKRVPPTSIAHWRRIAVASAKQCGRAVVPEIEPATPLETLGARKAFDLIVMFVEPALNGATPLTPADLAGQSPRSVLVLTGPEGGWAASEVEWVRSRGAALVSLGPRTLRAETAPVAALSALWTVWGW